jgi:nucleotide-binding universal stress UspA family protein
MVMNERSRGGLTELMVGNATEEVRERADVPVIRVQAEDSAA